MRIAKSTVSMAASRSFQSESQVTQLHLDRGQGAFQGQSRVTASTVRTNTSVKEGSAAVFQQTSQGGALPAEQSQQPAQANTKTQNQGQAYGRPAAPNWLANIQASIEKDPQVQMLRRMMELLERITGKKGSRDVLSKPSHSSGAFAMASAGYKHTSAFMGSISLSTGLSGGGLPVDGTGQPVNGYWMRQTIESGFVKGEEHTAFSSVGTAVTADGRTINFGITMEMSRSFEAAYQVVGKEEVFTDPLIINLDTDAAALDDVSFYFDLDCDGTEEEISSLAQGSGFLALDKNGDGKINDGSELFGAKTGDGFTELSQYDQDGNGWIDENDQVFSKLSVWVKCGDGEGKLLSLKEAGVGAIFLGSQGTQFTLTDSKGNENAQVRRTGMYLKESGQVGTVQHVDFRT